VEIDVGKRRLGKRLLLLAFLFLALTPAGASAAEPDDEARFVTLVNELRVSRGLASLEVRPQLVGPSRDWAATMAGNDDLAHAPDLSVGITDNWNKLGENVGVGPQDQLQQLFDAFVASPGHLQNLVDPQFRYIGIGVVYDQQGRMWTTHRFMSVAEAQTTTTARPPTTSPTAAPPRSAPRPTTTTPPPAPATLAFTAPAVALTPAAVAEVVDSMAGAGV
jgi:hypothetical protein